MAIAARPLIASIVLLEEVSGRSVRLSGAEGINIVRCLPLRMSNHARLSGSDMKSGPAKLGDYQGCNCLPFQLSLTPMFFVLLVIARSSSPFLSSLSRVPQ